MIEIASSLKKLPIFAVFPGQGSQFVGMGKDLYEQFSIAREVFEEASDSVRLDLKKLCFDSTESELTLTENTQPCLLTVSVAAFRVAQKELDFHPLAVAGHSLGEYSALVASDCLSLTMAVKWVRERGLAMQKAVPAGEGTMAAILGLSDDQVEALCQKATQDAKANRDQSQSQDLTIPAIVQPANFNAPGQVVIAGSSDAVQKAIDLIKTDSSFKGGKAIPLQVSAPFHCQLMKPVRDRMTELFSIATEIQKPKTPKYPYVPNRTGRISSERSLVFELLIEQVDHPVLWSQTIQALLDSQFSAAVEFGPGRVLTGLIKRIASHKSISCSLHSMSDSSSLKTLETFLHSIHPKQE